MYIGVGVKDCTNCVEKVIVNDTDGWFVLCVYILGIHTFGLFSWFGAVCFARIKLLVYAAPIRRIISANYLL